MDTEFQLQREGDKITLTVSVPKEEIKRKEQQLLASISRELSIPGFRPGKAPRHLVLSHYGQREFERDLLEALIEEGLKEALDRARLSPVTTPQVREVDFQPDKQLAFQASFEVLPEPEIPDGFSLPLEEPPPAEVSEEELNEVLADLRRQAAVLEPKGAPAEGGDVVRIRQGERVWEAEIDPQRTIGKQLVGVEAGTSVVLRDEEGHAEEFEVLEVYRLLVPDEEETAAYFGEESWQALRERVRAQLLAQKEAERKHALRLAALDALADQLQLEPPPGLLNQATEEEMQALKIKPELRGEVEQAVRRRLRREILARRVAEQKGLLPTQEEVEQAAREAGADPDRMWGRLVFRRAADWIIENSQRRAG